jgi:Ni/Fe-hydrogenase 1 B-type cytochrome subunit
MANCLKEKYVWEVPVRVCHWMNFLAIIVLSLTGIYIGAPKSLALNPTQFVMGWVRLVHFVAGYVFAISFVARLYWAFVGNRYASWREFFPFLNREGRANMKEMFRYYTFQERKVPHPEGHNALAGATYLLVFVLYLVLILTGFALYVEHAPQSLGHRLLGWMFLLFSNQGMRLTHHVAMWLLIGFAIHHIYSAWLMDVEERGGVMSSIFGGYKPVKEKE